MSHHNHQTFVKWSLLTLISALFISVGINVIIDPYSIFDSLSLIPRQYKDKVFDRQWLTKAVDIQKHKPKGILLGSSRMMQGINTSEVNNLLGVDFYNLGLSGASAEEIYAYFEYAVEHQPELKYVIVGIDLFAFNRNRRPRDGFNCSRLQRRGMVYDDWVQSLLTESACLASLDTLTRFCTGSLPEGLWLDTHGNLQEACMDAYIKKTHKTFQDLETIVLTSLLQEKETYGSFDLSEEALTLFDQMAATCRLRGIVLKAFISPCRAAYWYGLYRKGYWQALTTLKMRLADTMELWDFSCCNALVAEPLAPSSHYFDTGHFRPHIGTKIIAAMFMDTPDFGERMHSKSAAMASDRMLRDLLQWAVANPLVDSFISPEDSSTKVR